MKTLKNILIATLDNGKTISDLYEIISAMEKENVTLAEDKRCLSEAHSDACVEIEKLKKELTQQMTTQKEYERRLKITEEFKDYVLKDAQESEHSLVELIDQVEKLKAELIKVSARFRLLDYKLNLWQKVALALGLLLITVVIAFSYDFPKLDSSILAPVQICPKTITSFAGEIPDGQ